MDRKQAFQQLKKPCLDLLQVTSILAQRPEKRNELVTALTHLLDTLRSITSKPNSLDPKLAEYAFVPISQVLRLSQLVPVRALELSLECISKLLTEGWGGGIEPALSAQLLILFTFLAKPSSAGSGIAGTSEELQSLALRCMTELLQEISRSQRRDEITSTANIPALGEAVLVILDNLVDNKSNGVRLQATSALKAMIDAIRDDDALASFLPRMVSSITKVLSPSSSNRPSFRVVEKGLGVLSLLISRLLSDNATNSLPQIAQPTQSDITTQTTRSVSWLQATASQIKIAFANVFRLRDHDKMEVRKALLKLCHLVVQDCRISLSLCTGMAIETTISLAGREDQGSIEPELKTVLASDPKLVDVLREILHGWVLSLPRIMQSKDDHGRRLIIHQISVTTRLLEHETGFVNERLADSLRDSVSAILSDSRGLEELPETLSKDGLTRDLALSSSVVSQFPQLALRLKGQDDIMSEFKQLIRELAKSDTSVFILEDLVRSIDFGNREMRLASFWVSVNLLRDIVNTSASFDDFIDMGGPNPREELLDDLYSQSITLLNQQVHTTDLSWHFYALALETVALQASRYKAEFRAELSEVLYPVLHHLGNSNAALRSHSMICLNMIATYCGYSNAGELVVNNVDYIVNAVGLKLAAGDISPQAPQVLLMMIRLCGPSILPYLDDLVGSIFDALERYHGYPKLTELLFSVLQGMTEEGVKAPQLAITSGHEAIQRHRGTKKITIADVINAVKKIESDSRRRKAQDDEDDRMPFPQRPWKEDQPIPEDPGHRTHEGGDQEGVPQTEEAPPPAPRTFDMLLKISQLTQHYLTTESTSLRTSLLSLLKTTIPALAKHENSFLPLINTLWPVLLPRLEDPEAYIVSNALDTISLLCEHAGDFMRNRIDDAWDVLRKVHRRTQKRGTGRTNTSLQISRRLSGIEDTISDLSISSRALPRPEMYVDAPSRMIWNGLVGLFCSIARHVHVRDERFDEMLEILEPVLEKAEVKEAMDVGNADAVWLKLYEKRKVAGVKEGEDEGSKSLKMPQGKPHWNFVRV